MRRSFISPDLVLFVVLTVLAVWLMRGQNYTSKVEATSTLAGAIFGGAVLLLANWINRLGEASRESARKKRLENLISAELRTVAIGLLTAKERFLELAREAPQKPGRIVSIATAALIVPSDLPLTMSLGGELLILDPAALGNLIGLQGSLTSVLDFIQASGKVSGGVDAQALEKLADTTRDIIGGTLLDSFKEIAPTAKLRGQLATTVLEQAAKP